MTDIVERLMRQIETGPDVEDIVFINPDGPEAADEIERLRKALSANIAAALHIADVADIDVDGTVITIRRMPSGEVIAKKSWAAILGDGNAALEGK
jgi:hypothetical protein